MTPEFFIDKFNMQRHPEGGYFTETYRSGESIPKQSLPERFNGDRSFSTAILFLLVGDEFSSFHRIAADEVWHFHLGSPVEIVMIDDAGNPASIVLGSDIESGEVVQCMVPAGTWFASRCLDSKGYSFVGCTVAPGFDFADFELAQRSALTALFPQHAGLINRFTRS